MSLEETKQADDGIPNHSARSKSTCSGDMNNSKSSRSRDSIKKHKAVRFNDIQIRDYERTVGDNPSCSSGPPIAIGWAHGNTRFVNIDNYEHSRSGRRTQKKLVLNRQSREALLAYWDVPVNEIVEAIRGNVRVKNQRRQTVTNLGKVEKLEEAFESATRKLKKTLLLRRKGGKLKGHPVHSRVAPTPAMGAMKSQNGEHLRDFHKSSPEMGITDREKTEVKEDEEEYWKEASGEHSSKPAEIVYENDDTGSSISRFSAGNSTTPSIMEIERFYRELELEMFGDFEPPSMVGQTLEVPGVHIPDDQAYGKNECSIRSDLSDLGGPEQPTDMVLKGHVHEGRALARHASDISMNDLDDLHESSSVSRQRIHATRIPQYFHNTYEDISPQMYGELPHDDFSRLSRSLESLDLNHSGNSRNGGGVGVMPMHYQYPATSMRSPEHFHNQHQRTSSQDILRLRSLRDGPEIRHMPLQTHQSPSQFMGEGALPGHFGGFVNEPVTICEDTDGEDQLLLFGASQPYRGQQYFNNFPPEPEFQDPNAPTQSYYR